jgi:lipoyl(octanoyl) transferase
MPYAEALALQRNVARARIAGALDQDVLLLVEHPHVVTLGRSSKAGHLLASAELLARRGVELFEVERGGDTTYHGPGQLVGYPIVSLRRHKEDLHWYLRTVEAALIAALAVAGITAGRNAGFTGVWVGGGTTDDEDDPKLDWPPRKIASIGIHARDWVTWHGFALNVTTDLSFFDLIVPCGIAGVEMTSVARELGASAAVRPATVADWVVGAFGAALHLEPRSLSVEALRDRLELAALGAQV